MRRLFVDVETTGLSPGEGHKIVEVAAVAYEGDYKVTGDGAQFHQYINPARDIPAEAVKIHGLTAAKLQGKPPFAAIAEKLVGYLRGCVFVAHNVEFDIAFLTHELEVVDQPGVIELVDSVVDTLTLANELYPQQRNNLNALARRFGIDIEQRRKFHGALVDAEILAEVYQLMHSGQSDLDLHADSRSSNLRMPVGKIDIVALPPSEAVANTHAEYMQKMFAETGVKPVASFKKQDW